MAAYLDRSGVLGPEPVGTALPTTSGEICPVAAPCLVPLGIVAAARIITIIVALFRQDKQAEKLAAEL